MKKTKVILSALLAAMMFCGFAVVAHAKTKKQTKPTAPKAVSSEVTEEQEDNQNKGIRLEDATPEEIADIGVGAQIAAGQKPDNVTVVTVTDLLPEKPEEVQENVTEKSSSLDTAVAVLIALVSVLFFAVGVLYYFAYRAGLFNPDRK